MLKRKHIFLCWFFLVENQKQRKQKNLTKKTDSGCFKIRLLCYIIDVLLFAKEKKIIYLMIVWIQPKKSFKSWNDQSNNQFSSVFLLFVVPLIVYYKFKHLCITPTNKQSNVSNHSIHSCPYFYFFSFVQFQFTVGKS